ncbi:putative virion core protein-like protein [Seal parapoxvirus]|uniref:Putative virion core protein-like protein n=1 Tax=Seal parapoxvirus TaxID=187984 RepID=A0A1Z3GCW8_9POXV|nr:putative virion core protein-like protein [Seal parapoxvirus]ASC55609.1 putative virion core protein-like protein [Seal parapoxvirus]
MEAINVFLETASGRVRILYAEDDECKCPAQCRATARRAAVSVLKELDKFIVVDESTFTLAIRDEDIFYYLCDKGRISLADNEFYLFHHGLLFADNAVEDAVTGVGFVITDTTHVRVVPRDGISVTVYSNNSRAYEGML